jgi:hypothetical protein
MDALHKETTEFWAAEDDYWLVTQSAEDGPIAVYDSTAGYVVIRQKVPGRYGPVEQMVFVRPENAKALAKVLHEVAGLMK